MLKKLAILLLHIPLLTSFVQGQYNRSDDYSAVSSNKSVTDYFDSVDEKSFYQRKRIHGMKNEINSYSERLHKLQNRFDEIFYGLSARNSYSKPFDTNTQPSRPEPKVFDTQPLDLYNRNIQPNPPTFSNDQSDLFEPKPVDTENQLAFEVDGPGSYSSEGKRKALFDPKNHSGLGKLGKYFILTPGYAIPYKIHKPSVPIQNKETYRRYDPGVSILVSGGFEKNNFRFGLGGLYKKNRHHETSYKYLTGSGKTIFQNHAETFAGFLDLGYEFTLFGNFDGYFGAGLGYYLSIIEDPQSRKDHGFFATGNIGLAYNFNEMIALRLGYRYLHEEEVPAHVAELGLGFEF